MAFSFSATASTAPPQPSLSCRATICSGLRINSATPFGTARPSIGADFFNKVNLSIHGGTCKPTRGRFEMMSLGTPRVLYKTPGEGTMQWVDIWNALYRERIIFIGEHIDEDYSNQLLATMLYLDSIDSSKRLYMYINVAGGDVTPSLAIYDTMQSLKTPVGTLCLGYAMNLMGFVLAAGEKGHRYAMPHARIGLKSPANYTRGQADDVVNESKELLRISDYLCQELAEKTGQPLERVSRDFKFQKTKYFNSQEALEYGIIDRIYEQKRAITADDDAKDGPRSVG